VSQCGVIYEWEVYKDQLQGRKYLKWLLLLLYIIHYLKKVFEMAVAVALYNSLFDKFHKIVNIEKIYNNSHQRIPKSVPECLRIIKFSDVLLDFFFKLSKVICF